MSQRVRSAFLTAGVATLSLCAESSRAALVLFQAGGDATTASIQATVDAFRSALGNPNNGNAAGPLASGRREINWDGGGSAVASPAGTPFTGFQNIRGATFTTPGTGFLQTPLNAPELAAINPSYATTFGVFSPLRIFTPVGSNITDTTFSIPGTGGATPATVAGFGAVFTDVDLASSSTMEFFDPNGLSLGSFSVPIGTVANASLSFLGVLADAGEQIARVRIIAGNAALGPNDGSLVDVAAMDDFFYSEPQALAAAVPTPPALLLALSGLAMLAATRRVSARARTSAA